MESFNESNCDTARDTEPKRKRRRIQNDVEGGGGGGGEELNHHLRNEGDSRNAAYNQATKRWRTEREQQIYSSKLLQAIQHVRRRSSSAKTGQEIHQTADRVLAVSAKGASRWSRAILSSPLSVRLRKRQVKVKVTGCSRLRRKPGDWMRIKKMKLPPVQKKLRVLSRLIPGCRKVSSLNLLEEATDYISALEMQVRAMTALTAILAGDDRIGFNVNP